MMKVWNCAVVRRLWAFGILFLLISMGLGTHVQAQNEEENLLSGLTGIEAYFERSFFPQEILLTENPELALKQVFEKWRSSSTREIVAALGLDHPNQEQLLQILYGPWAYLKMLNWIYINPGRWVQSKAYLSLVKEQPAYASLESQIPQPDLVQRYLQNLVENFMAVKLHSAQSFWEKISSELALPTQYSFVHASTLSNREVVKEKEEKLRRSLENHSNQTVRNSSEPRWMTLLIRNPPGRNFIREQFHEEYLNTFARREVIRQMYEDFQNALPQQEQKPLGEWIAGEVLLTIYQNLRQGVRLASRAESVRENVVGILLQKHELQGLSRKEQQNEVIAEQMARVLLQALEEGKITRPQMREAILEQALRVESSSIRDEILQEANLEVTFRRPEEARPEAVQTTQSEKKSSYRNWEDVFPDVGVEALPQVEFIKEFSIQSLPLEVERQIQGIFGVGARSPEEKLRNRVELTSKDSEIVVTFLKAVKGSDYASMRDALISTKNELTLTMPQVSFALSKLLMRLWLDHGGENYFATLVEKNILGHEKSLGEYLSHFSQRLEAGSQIGAQDLGERAIYIAMAVHRAWSRASESYPRFPDRVLQAAILEGLRGRPIEQMQGVQQIPQPTKVDVGDESRIVIVAALMQYELIKRIDPMELAHSKLIQQAIGKEISPLDIEHHLFRFLQACARRNGPQRTLEVIGRSHMDSENLASLDYIFKSEHYPSWSEISLSVHGGLATYGEIKSHWVNGLMVVLERLEKGMLSLPTEYGGSASSDTTLPSLLGGLDGLKKAFSKDSLSLAWRGKKGLIERIASGIKVQKLTLQSYLEKEWIGSSVSYDIPKGGYRIWKNAELVPGMQKDSDLRTHVLLGLHALVNFEELGRVPGAVYVGQAKKVGHQFNPDLEQDGVVIRPVIASGKEGVWFALHYEAGAHRVKGAGFFSEKHYGDALKFAFDSLRDPQESTPYLILPNHLVRSEGDGFLYETITGLRTRHPNLGSFWERLRRQMLRDFGNSWVRIWCLQSIDDSDRSISISSEGKIDVTLRSISHSMISVLREKDSELPLTVRSSILEYLSSGDRLLDRVETGTELLAQISAHESNLIDLDPEIPLLEWEEGVSKILSQDLAAILDRPMESEGDVKRLQNYLFQASEYVTPRYQPRLRALELIFEQKRLPTRPMRPTLR